MIKVDDTLTSFCRLFPALVSGGRYKRRSPGARNHDTVSRQMIPAEKETEMYSDFEKFDN